MKTVRGEGVSASGERWGGACQSHGCFLLIPLRSIKLRPLKSDTEIFALVRQSMGAVSGKNGQFSKWADGQSLWNRNKGGYGGTWVTPRGS